MLRITDECYKLHYMYKIFHESINLVEDLYRKTQKRDDTIIVDTRTFSEYKKGHVPGAVNVDLFQLHWFDTTKRGIKDFNRQTRLCYQILE